MVLWLSNKQVKSDKLHLPKNHGMKPTTFLTKHLTTKNYEQSNNN